MGRHPGGQYDGNRGADQQVIVAQLGHGKSPSKASRLDAAQRQSRSSPKQIGSSNMCSNRVSQCTSSRDQSL
jgi:hypothetical protein